ncbi:MAG: nicotinamide-nucleotide adenylyltransferase [Lachnospiraceae bacterium]|nr:nicotinamide-nucleotide adenylyltransferase [Lachnospiraceae bacterium]
MRYQTGIFGGGFDPLHLGHVHTILHAAAMCGELNIILSCSESRDRIPVKERYRWLLALTGHLPNVKIRLLPDECATKEEYDSRDYWEEGAARVRAMLGKPVDAVFCGSDYKGQDRWEKLYPEAEVIYEDRSLIPVSSTQIHADPFRYWEYIPETVRPHYVKTVLLAGGESTGKSTLTENLAKCFNTVFVPEAGRDFCAEAGGEDWMTAEDLQKCVLYQKTAVWEGIKKANKILFIDTDALTTKFYIQFLIGNKAKEKPDFSPEGTAEADGKARKQSKKAADDTVKTLALADAVDAVNTFDLILFLEPDVPYIDDSTRSGTIRSDRELYSQQLKSLFDESGYRYHCLSGDYEDRFTAAETLVQALMRGESENL